MSTPLYLMSPPPTNWRLEGRTNFRSRDADDVDASRARLEWQTLAEAIVDAGGDVAVVPPNPGRHLSGMMYTAEAGEFFRTDAGEPAMLLPNMAVEHRRPEADWLGGFYAGLGLETHAVEATWEGQGDVIRGRTADQTIHTYGTGPDARTEAAAYEEVADRISERHLHLPFDAAPWFHGNTFMNVYRSPETDESDDPDDILLMICPDAIAESDYRRLREFLGDPPVCEITREQSLGYDTNALQVGGSVLASRTLSETAASALESLGLTIRRLDFHELFEKGGGAPVCLTNRLWRLSPTDLPNHALWSSR